MFCLRRGVNFNEIFLPFVRHNSMWMLSVIIALFDLKLERPIVLRMFLLGVNLHQRKVFFVKGKEFYLPHFSPLFFCVGKM
jgi:hypothetical protein